MFFFIIVRNKFVREVLVFLKSFTIIFFCRLYFIVGIVDIVLGYLDVTGVSGFLGDRG